MFVQNDFYIDTRNQINLTLFFFHVLLTIVSCNKIMFFERIKFYLMPILFIPIAQ